MMFLPNRSSIGFSQTTVPWEVLQYASILWNAVHQWWTTPSRVLMSSSFSSPPVLLWSSPWLAEDLCSSAWRISRPPSSFQCLWGCSLCILPLLSPSCCWESFLPFLNLLSQTHKQCNSVAQLCPLEGHFWNSIELAFIYQGLFLQAHLCSHPPATKILRCKPNILYWIHLNTNCFYIIDCITTI